MTRPIKIKERIIKLLKQGRASSTRIALELKTNYPFVLKQLAELKSGGLIACEKETVATYWKIQTSDMETAQ